MSTGDPYSNSDFDANSIFNTDGEVTRDGLARYNESCPARNVRFLPTGGSRPGTWKDDKSSTPPMFCKASELPEPESWEPPSIFPAGALTNLLGDPGCGKTTIALDAAARISSGRELPDGTKMKKRGVLFLSTEDDQARVLRPRLKAMGANLDNIYFTTSDKYLHDWTPLQTMRVFKELRECDIALIVLDPVGDFLSVENENNERDVRLGLSRWLGPAAELEISVLGIKHVTKSQQRTARMAGLGSVAFPARARSQLIAFAKDSGGVLTSSKNNYLKTGWARKFTMIDLPHPGSAGLTVPGLAWGPLTDISADEEYAAGHAIPNYRKDRTADIDAQLTEILEAGPTPRSTVIEKLGAYGYSEDQVRRSSDRLNVIKARDGKAMTWRLPITGE